MASEKTLEMRPKDKIIIDRSVADMKIGEPQYIGTYKKVVDAVGKDESLRLYSGMTSEKSDFICSCGGGMDMLSVQWKLDRLEAIAANGGRLLDSMRKKRTK